MELLQCPPWSDYELLDSGAGQKLERFGAYRLVRPEPQALWAPALAATEWARAEATFAVKGEEEGGSWEVRSAVPDRWEMRYQGVKLWARLTSFRHIGVFPEQAAEWEWLQKEIEVSGRPARVLDLFGYTGLASLACARAGAAVTYVDASKKAYGWARENQALSAMQDKPIRWFVDDALKFIRREARRGVRYEGIILDPPKFGRGPRGEVWKLDEMLPALLAECRMILADQPLFVLLTAYAIRSSALSLYFALREMMQDWQGTVGAGELVIPEKSAGRLLATAIFARWAASEGG